MSSDQQRNRQEQVGEQNVRDTENGASAAAVAEKRSIAAKKRESRNSQDPVERKSEMSRSFEAEGLAKLFGIQSQTDSKKRNHSLFEGPPGEENVDWTIVLESLQVVDSRTFNDYLFSLISIFFSFQREKMLAIARKEEHYVNRSLFYFTSSSMLRFFSASTAFSSCTCSCSVAEIFLIYL